MEKHARALALGLLCVPALACAGIDDIAETDFIKKSSLEFGTHNIWKYLNEGETDKRYVHSAWGQGLSLDYTSGYLSDVIGVDASYYGVIKLAAADNFASRGILYNDEGKAKGFNKLGQIYGKAKLSEGGVDANLYGGWKLLKLGVLTTSMRAAPNTYQGWIRAGAGILPTTPTGYVWVTSPGHQTVIHRTKWIFRPAIQSR